MLTKDNFTLEHVLELKENRMVDSFILERSIYAFVLLEALCRVNIRSIVTHVYDERFSAEKAAVMSCRVMHMAACVLKNVPYEHIHDYGLYIKKDIGSSRYSKLSKLRKFNVEGFAHIVKAVEILQE